MPSRVEGVAGQQQPGQPGADQRQQQHAADRDLHDCQGLEQHRRRNRLERRVGPAEQACTPWANMASPLSFCRPECRISEPAATRPGARRILAAENTADSSGSGTLDWPSACHGRSGHPIGYCPTAAAASRLPEAASGNSAMSSPACFLDSRGRSDRPPLRDLAAPTAVVRHAGAFARKGGKTVADRSREIRLAARPRGEPVASDFRMVEHRGRRSRPRARCWSATW